MVRGWTNTMGGVGASAADQLTNRWSNSYTVGESLMMAGPVFPGDFSHQQEVLEGPLGGTQKIHWEWSRLGSTPTGVEGMLRYRQDAQGKGSDGGQGQPQPSNHPAGPQGWSRSRLRQKSRKLVRVSMVSRHLHGTAQPGQGLGTSKAALAWQGRPQVRLSPAPSHAHPSCFPVAWSQVSLHQVKAGLKHRQPDPKEDREEAQASDTAKVKWRNVSKCLQWKNHNPPLYFASLHNQMPGRTTGTRAQVHQEELVEGRGWKQRGQGSVVGRVKAIPAPICPCPSPDFPQGEGERGPCPGLTSRVASFPRLSQPHWDCCKFPETPANWTQAYSEGAVWSQGFVFQMQMPLQAQRPLIYMTPVGATGYVFRGINASPVETVFVSYILQ